MLIGLIELIATFIGATFATHLDADESKRKKFYGKEEGTKRLRNDDGSANIAKLWLWGMGVPVVASIALLLGGHFGMGAYPEQYDAAPFAPFLMGSIPFAVQGIWRFIIWKGNVKKSRENRIKQIEWRSKMRSALDSGDEYAYVRLLDPETEVKGVWYPFWTPWLTVSAPDSTAAAELLKPILRKWVDIPDGNLREIWIDLKYHA
jgi:hypothetical protein